VRLFTRIRIGNIFCSIEIFERFIMFLSPEFQMNVITANNEIQQTIIEVKYVLTMLKIKILDISAYIVINLPNHFCFI